MEGAAPAARRPAAPRERSEGPRGRGLGTPKATVFRCSRCGALQADSREPGIAPKIDAVCGDCGTDLHTCTHCAHFDTSAPFQCRQPIAQRITKKDLRNECELLELKLTQEFAAEAEPPSDARTAFDDLFNL